MQVLVPVCLVFLSGCVLRIFVSGVNCFSTKSVRVLREQRTGATDLCFGIFPFRKVYQAHRSGGNNKNVLCHYGRTSLRGAFPMGEGWGGSDSNRENEVLYEKDRNGSPIIVPLTIGKLALEKHGCHAGAPGSFQGRFSSKEALDFAHLLRRDVDAVVTGIDTVIKDDCQLTVRRVPTATGDDAHQPLRVVLDSNLRIPRSSKILTDKHPAAILYRGSRQHSLKAERLTSYLAERIQSDLSSPFEALSSSSLLLGGDMSTVPGFDRSLAAITSGVKKAFIGVTPEEQRSAVARSERRVNLMDSLILLRRKLRIKKILVECGPRLMTRFLQLGLLDALVLVVSHNFAFPEGDGLRSDIVDEDALVNSSFNLEQIGEEQLEGDTVHLWAPRGGEREEKVKEIFERASRVARES